MVSIHVIQGLKLVLALLVPVLGILFCARRLT